MRTPDWVVRSNPLLGVTIVMLTNTRGEWYYRPTCRSRKSCRGDMMRNGTRDVLMLATVVVLLAVSGYAGREEAGSSSRVV